MQKVNIQEHLGHSLIPNYDKIHELSQVSLIDLSFTTYVGYILLPILHNFYSRVITREADLVTAHEFGHNWGSEHDPDVPECSPSASHGGSYLMYTYSVSGYDVNNKKFSPCSLRFIRKVSNKHLQIH